MVLDGASLIWETRLKLPTDSGFGFFEMSRFQENVRYVPRKYLELAKNISSLLAQLACLGMWQIRKTATMTTRTMARFASRRPDLPERMWVYLQYSTVQYSTVQYSTAQYTLQSGKKFPRYLHKYIYIYLSIYS